MIEWHDMMMNMPLDSVGDLGQLKVSVSQIRVKTGAWIKQAMKNPGNSRFVFGAPQWGTFVDDALSEARTSHLSTEFERLTKKLGIINPNNGNGKSFHMLRHAFVTRLSSNGLNLEDIAKHVGHSSTTTTKMYDANVPTLR